MIVQYPAKLEQDNSGYIVTFPDLDGCVTEGDNLQDALYNAKEALTGYLASIFERGFNIPQPSSLKGKNIYSIEPDPEVAIPIILRRLRQKKGFSQKKLAQALGVSYQAYQKLENPRYFNPTIKRLHKIGQILEKDLKVSFGV